MTSTSQADGAEAARPASWLGNLVRRNKWFVLFVILPVLVASGYYGLIASDRYISESRFVIKSPGQRQPQLSTLANLIQTSGLSAGQEQANEVMEYLRSRDALAALDKRIAFAKRYEPSSADAWSRFPGPFSSGTFEDLYKYYQRAVSANSDHETGVVVLSVWGFSPQDAQRVNGELLRLGEEMVNRLNDRAQSHGIEEGERRVALAEARVRKARLAMREYRNAAELLDPAKQAAGVLEVTNRLVSEQAGLRAQLEEMERVAPENPSIPTLRARIATIGNQIALQSGRVAGTQGGIASKLGQYENLLAEQEFSQQMLTAASASLEQARSEAQKQQFYLERVVEPNLPDEPQLPHRLRQILSVAGVSLCLYLIGWMLVVGILEHSPDS
ncbi:Wzz/FepE/Etk N-terminal domain-containing protein [Novosphingobium bradum]|uniref:Wzz/FepE/Etk N-terminal domain-containing protein n=1 Tax=Novosphingobium bradum TaxID=1737444 RepID=A0ABV7IM47_9SPHN